MAKNKVRFIKPGSMAQQVPEYEKQRQQKIELNNIRLAKRGFERMANSLVGLKKKGKTKNTKEAKNMRAMDIDDDEEYQPLEDENNLSSDDDHLTFYSDEEEIVINNCIVYSRLTNISLVILILYHMVSD